MPKTKKENIKESVSFVVLFSALLSITITLVSIAN
ncbi:hypothetical protein NRS6096_22315 (plasmid) [Bacillus subtilis]|nr:hypothetical protein NRS6096_22315 [Bacillus subtilis]